MRAGNVAQLGKNLKFTSVAHKPGMVVHAYSPSISKWREGDKKSKVIEAIHSDG